MADETETKVTVIRVAEAASWIQLTSDENGSELPLAQGGFAFEHGSHERVHSVDYSRVPSVRPREIPTGPGKDAPKITVAMCAMRVLFISDPMSPEEAAQGEQQIAVDPDQVAAGSKIVLPGNNGRR